MANHKSALKRQRQNEKRRLYNRAWRSRTRTFVKKARTALEGTSAEAATVVTLEAIQELDKAATKGVIHKRNAARKKSRLQRQLNALQAEQK